MANKLKAIARVTFRPEDRALVDLNEKEFSYDASSKNHVSGIQAAGTTEEVLQVGDVAAGALIYIKNLDGTNFVNVGLTGSYPIKLLAGQFCLFPSIGAIYVKGDTASCDIEFAVFPPKT